MSQVNADNEFECIRDSMRPIPMTIVAVGEHVGEIERSNRTITERTRCHVHQLLYSRYPKDIVVRYVICSVIFLKQLPTQDELSEDQSLSALITG